MADTKRSVTEHIAITGVSADVVDDRLKRLPIGSVLAVSRHPDVVLVELENAPKNAHAALREIRGLLPEDARVEFALEDQYGNEVYPTGTIQVRFTDAPSDDDLSALCDDLGLEFIARNAFQPKQVAFEAIDKLESDLKTDLSRLTERPEVRKAWPEVRAKFRRY